MYKVKFRNPMENLVASKRISAEDIPDLQQMKKLERQGFDLIFNPSPDWNSHFIAIAYHLQSIGIYRSAKTLRHEVVSDLINNPAFGRTNFIPDFLDMGWEDYLRKI